LSEIAYISASQIETWRDCKRKWAWSKLDRIGEPQNIAAQKGKIVHAVLEAWLKEGKPIDPDMEAELADGSRFKPGPIAAAGLKHLPMPKTCGTERHIFVQTEKISYQGYIDFDEKDKEVPVVGDHKTTGDFKWAKTEEDLRKDPAATIYAAALMAETNKEEVDLRWIYYSTRGAPRSKLVTLRLSREQVEKNFDDLDATGLEILEARSKYKTALELEPNLQACDRYGGCPFRENCNLSPLERMKGIMALETLQEKMRARAAAKAAGGASNGATNGVAPEAVVQAQAPAAVVEAQTPASGGLTLQEKMRARSAAVQSAKTAPEAPAEAQETQKAAPSAAGGSSIQERMKARSAQAGAAKGINPPEGPSEKVAAQAAPAVQAKSATKGGLPPFTLFVDCVPSKVSGVAVLLSTKDAAGKAALPALEQEAMTVVRPAV
jgi:RecB family exonuclease